MIMVDRYVHKIFQAEEVEAPPRSVNSILLIEGVGMRAQGDQRLVTFLDGDQLIRPDVPHEEHKCYIVLKGVVLKELERTMFLIGDVCLWGVTYFNAQIDGKNVPMLRASVQITGTVQEGAELVPFNSAA